MRFTTFLAPLTGALLSLAAAVPLSAAEEWQSMSGSFNGWRQLGNANWRIENDEFVADAGSGHLVTQESFADVRIRLEFWVSEGANSGVFLRASDPDSIADSNAYEVNIFDQRKDPTYGTGGIVNFVEVDPMPKAGGKWNTYEITAQGRHLVVVLNGQKTADYRNGMFTEGPITLQYGAGTIKFRKVAIKPL